MADEKAVGKRLRIWRKSLGKTQIEFSDMSNVGIAILRKCEGGTSMPGGHTLIALASTGVNLHWLLTGEGKMATPTCMFLRPYFDLLYAIEEKMAFLSDDKCQDILCEMDIKVKHQLHIQELERKIMVLKKNQRSHD